MKLRLLPLFLFSLFYVRSLPAFDYNHTWGVNLEGGINTQAMGDVNSVANQYGGGIYSGEEFGLTVSYGFTPKIMMLAGAGEILNQTTFTGGQVSLPALSIVAGGEYVAFPNLFNLFDLSVVGVVEYDILNGSTSIDPGEISQYNAYSNAREKHSNLYWAGSGGGGTPTGTAPSGDQYEVTNCSGSTFGGALSAKLRYFLFTQFAIGLEGGYRYSHIYNVYGTENYPPYESGPENETVDYSGAFGRLSGSYYF